jgi:hypothetical protein
MSRRRYNAEQIADMLTNIPSDEEIPSEDDASVDERDNIEMNDYPQSDEFEMESPSEQSSESCDDDDDDNDIVCGRNGFQWSRKSPHRASFRQQNIVRESLGLAPPVRDLESVDDFFRYVIDYRLIRDILFNTNKRLPHDAMELVENEIYAYIGLLLLFGLSKKCDVEIQEIWKKDSVHFLPLAVLTMSRNRFLQINRHITFDDIDSRNERKVNDPKCYKIREMMTHFRDKIRQAIVPSEELCVDETLYAFRGKCSVRQYMPNKPNKYGLKYWTIVDGKTGYALDTTLYAGKEQPGNRRNMNVGENVVLELCRPYFRTGRGVTVDNFFTSIPLANRLWQEGMTLTGTLRQNKVEIPASCLTKNRDLYSSEFLFAGPLTLCSYACKPKKMVVLLSTEHHTSTIDSNDKKTPKIIEAYNDYKGGVDALDWRIEKYTCRRKTARWTLNVFFYLLDVAAANAVVLSKLVFVLKNEPRNLSPRYRKDALEKLARSLLQPCIDDRISKWQVSRQGIPRELQHLAMSLGFLSSTPGGAHGQLQVPRNSSGRCHLCPRSLDRKTRMNCVFCVRFCCKEHCSQLCEDCKQSFE